jgi:hypothetical protein
LATNPVDRLTQSFGTPGTRRAALGVLLGTPLLCLPFGEAGAKGRHHSRTRRGRAAGPFTVEAQADAKPQDVTITVTAPRGGDGTFSASGAVSDEGTVISEAHFSASGSPAFLIVHATDVFVGERGTFTLKRQVKVTPTDASGILAGTGSWVVISGTDAYAGLHGQGTITLILDENPQPAQFTFTFTGQAHLD